MRVLSVASEIFPLIKTGGLADVAGALPLALGRTGIAVRSLVPGYPAVLQQLEGPERVHTVPQLFGGPAHLLSGCSAGLDLFVIDAPHLYDRPGNPYAGPDGRDWPDNFERFAALGQVAALIGQGFVPAFVPDVVHAHDWQAGLAPTYLHYSGGLRPGTLMSVHNVAFQGNFPAELFPKLGLPADAYRLQGVEYYGGIGFLKAGVQTADRITTVSPSYAQEIRSAAAGMGLEGLFRARASVLSGILNGIDTDVWNPATDERLAARFEAARLERRSENKRALQQRFGIAEHRNALLLGVVSRLSWQKGLDLLIEGLPAMLPEGSQLVVLGSGDAEMENRLRFAAEAYPERIGVVFGYDEALAHLLQGGADVILAPSRFEPCGLTQLCAMRYGAIPLVSRVGGLADSVIDANTAAQDAGVATGIQFAPVTEDVLTGALARAADLWRKPEAWRRMQANGMAQDLGWSRPAARYMALYREIARDRGAGA